MVHNHPSQVGEWEKTPPWSGILLPDHETTNLGKEFSCSDDLKCVTTHGHDIAQVSQIMLQQNAILCGDATAMLQTLPDEHFSCCITSPPYWQSMHSGKYQLLGAECDPFEYVRNLSRVFREVRRTLTPSGTLWLVIGDAYASDNPEWWAMYKKNAQNRSPNQRAPPEGFKPNDMMGIPWRVALELQNDGWYLRSDIIWSIPNYPLESNRDRPARIHNYIFLLAKSERHLYNNHSVDALCQ